MSVDSANEEQRKTATSSENSNQDASSTRLDNQPPKTTSQSSPNSETKSPAESLNLLPNALAQFWQRLRAPETSEALSLLPVVIMGTKYGGGLGLPEVAEAIKKRLWFTYRTGFEPIARAPEGPSPISFFGSMIVHGFNPQGALTGLLDTNNFSSDVGWGCMIRTAQCLLANTLQAVIARDAERRGKTPDWHAINDRVISLFRDSYASPFSLHNFVSVASHLPLKVKPGQWFGPSAASLSIKRLCTRANENSAEVPKLNVMICESCDLHDNEIKAVFDQSPSPLLLLFPIRLGIETINAIYYPSLLQLLSLPQSMGIAGGKPSSSYYFFGYQDDQLLYLDPHRSQQIDESNNSYKPQSCNTVPISGLDPSMVVGILVESYADYEQLKNELKGTNKIAHFHDHAPHRRSFSTPAPEKSAEYVEIPGHTSEDRGDFVDIGEEFVASEPESDQDNSTSVSTNFDIVEGPSAVTVLDDED